MQLVPPNNHRRNYAERAIGIFKNHFISGLSTLHRIFPLELWCRLLPQAEDSLNILQFINFNPSISAYTALHGEFYYESTPILSPELKLIIHEKPSQRRLWDPRGVDVWDLRSAKNHYRCHCVYCSKTKSERVTETINILPQETTPSVTLQEAAIMATEKLTETT